MAHNSKNTPNTATLVASRRNLKPSLGTLIAIKRAMENVVLYAISKRVEYRRNKSNTTTKRTANPTGYLAAPQEAKMYPRVRPDAMP